MQDQFSEFTTKKNLASLLVLAILVLAIPLGVNLVRQQQILKSRASGEQISFASPGIDQRTAPNGSPVTVALDQTVGLNIGLPDGWSYTETTPIPAEAGLTGKYFNNLQLQEPSVLTRTDPNVNFNWDSTSPGTGVNTNNFSVKWTGKINPKVSGSYTFYVSADDAARLWVNNQLIINQWNRVGWYQEFSGNISLTAGEKVNIRLDFQEATALAHISLSWSASGLSKEVIPESQLSTDYQNPGDLATPPPVINPIAEWKLDEGSGAIITDSTGVHNGVYVGGNPIWKSGQNCVRGTCLQFGSAFQDNIQVNDLGLKPQKITVSAWAKSTSATWNTFGWVLSNRTSIDGNGYNLHPWGFAKNFTFYVGVGNKWYAASTEPADITGWHHYVGTYDGDAVKLYIDGALVKSNSSPDGNISYSGTSSILTIGKDDAEMSSAKNRYGDGFVDEVQIYDRALTDQEVKDLYGSYGYPHP